MFEHSLDRLRCGSTLARCRGAIFLRTRACVDGLCSVGASGSGIKPWPSFVIEAERPANCFAKIMWEPIPSPTYAIGRLARGGAFARMNQ
jgi:hypothetical protein